MLTGVLKVQCTNDLKDNIRKSGRPACILVMDEIKSLDHVADVWLPGDSRIDIIVETTATNMGLVEELKDKILLLDGIQAVHQNISCKIE